MSLTYNGTEINQTSGNITYNGSTVKEVTMNGVSVWKKVTDINIRASLTGYRQIIYSISGGGVTETYYDKLSPKTINNVKASEIKTITITGTLKGYVDTDLVHTVNVNSARERTGYITVGDSKLKATISISYSNNTITITCGNLYIIANNYAYDNGGGSSSTVLDLAIKITYTPAE